MKALVEGVNTPRNEEEALVTGASLKKKTHLLSELAKLGTPGRFQLLV